MPHFPPIRQRKLTLRASSLLLLLALLVYGLVDFLSWRFVVDGPSMNPTLATGQFLLVSRINNEVFQRGDIVVFRLPQDPDRDLVKRVVALPHEAVEMRDTALYINGERLVEPYLAEACEPVHCSAGFWQLGADEYFLLGDNRNQSYDSRSFGVIPRNLILGKALLRYWPLNELAWMNR